MTGKRVGQSKVYDQAALISDSMDDPNNRNSEDPTLMTNDEGHETEFSGQHDSGR